MVDILGNVIAVMKNGSWSRTVTDNYYDVPSEKDFINGAKVMGEEIVGEKRVDLLDGQIFRSEFTGDFARVDEVAQDCGFLELGTHLGLQAAADYFRELSRRDGHGSDQARQLRQGVELRAFSSFALTPDPVRTMAEFDRMVISG